MVISKKFGSFNKLGSKLLQIEIELELNVSHSNARLDYQIKAGNEFYYSQPNIRKPERGYFKFEDNIEELPRSLPPGKFKAKVFIEAERWLKKNESEENATEAALPNLPFQIKLAYRKADWTDQIIVIQDEVVHGPGLIEPIRPDDWRITSPEVRWQ